jgi:hypothetical protein
LNVAMMTSNNALVPDPDKQDDLASLWWQWPILHVGLRMCSWDDNIVKYFLLGNPIVYWGTTASLGLFGLAFLVYLLRWQRGCKDLTKEDIDEWHYHGFYPLIGWAFHYIPFIMMGRVTYVHHYYPALYFAILVFGFLFNFFAKKLPTKVSWAVYGVMYAIIIGVFILFIPISFGMKGPADQYKYLKWTVSVSLLSPLCSKANYRIEPLENRLDVHLFYSKFLLFKLLGSRVAVLSPGWGYHKTNPLMTDQARLLDLHWGFTWGEGNALYGGRSIKCLLLHYYLPLFSSFISGCFLRIVSLSGIEGNRVGFILQSM